MESFSVICSYYCEGGDFVATSTGVVTLEWTEEVQAQKKSRLKGDWANFYFLRILFSFKLNKEHIGEYWKPEC